jgi:hypothetical protein
MSAVFFEEAPEVREMASKIIDKYHPHLKDAKEVIGYYFRDGNSDWAGKAKKCTAFERHVTGYMLFVFINKDAWRLFTPDQRHGLWETGIEKFAAAVREADYQMELEDYEREQLRAVK